MNILGISGSPRIRGNSDILLDKALEGARSKGAKSEKVILNTLEFAPCQECENIRRDGTCIIEDDMQVIYGKIKNADAIVLASPIFFGSLSAQTKMMIDRFQCLWLAKYVFKTYRAKKRRVGALICVEASSRRDFLENAKKIVRNFFAVIDTIYKEELFCTGIDRKAAILEHKLCLKKAFRIGESIASGEQKGDSLGSIDWNAGNFRG